MVFDWFRRQFNQPQAPSTAASEAVTESSESTDDAARSTTEAVEEPQTAAIAEPPPAEPAPAIAEDYLAWAKAAYQNLKQQEAPAETSTTAEAIAATPALSDAQLAEEPAGAEAASSPEEISTETVAEPEPEPQPPAEPASFFDLAASEREARLEQLAAEAIVEPEPEPEPQPPAIAEPAEPQGLVFDDDFVWSSEVLAAQGRRPEEISIEEIDWLSSLRRGLDKTRRNLVNQLKAVVGQGPLSGEAVETIEALLLQADVGVEATDRILSQLQDKLRQEALPPEQAIAYLKSLLQQLLDQPLEESGRYILAPEKGRLNVWLVCGVNGVGKTTTIGKLAHLATKSGYRCLIAAADTFRAAAVEQVKVWGARSEVEVIANPGQNTDPAAVVFDAIAAAQARGTELLLVDTAGRLQNKKNLMDELAKVRRIIDRKAPDAIVESLLVLDATQGQNGLRQAQVFSEAAQLSGVALTKLDSTAKGGVALAIAQDLRLPIRFLGAGERIEDLRPFSSYEFIQALLDG
ncbi:signal recognition particle-docking protein FtsY [Synechococcus elongatus]|uniref:Signal recognition particle receptor FtsY n=1 Tax=Synechococcus elongatus PCC 11801 TaxID=2219813 RepID=A0AAN1QMD3_SYNEL|nr:signal recognition particle-docking protein FtsY [Synechococcus elongatus]AZB72016.1 signal recognition particle-docking protein FtsY [Synechococcus elongatus PCC 11801]